MNKNFTFVIFTFCAVVIFSHEISLKAGQGHPNIDFVETKIMDGFFMGVTDEFGHTNTSPDNKLCFSIWTTNKIQMTNEIKATNYLNVIFPTQPEYAYQVELFDTNGIAIPKTETGKKVGTKFLDFNTNSFVLRSTGPGGYFGPSGTSGVKSQLTSVSDKMREPYGQMLLMFCPSDLFNINKPRTYTLRIRFQIIAFPRTGPNRGDYTKNLIRFLPLDYPLVKVDAATKEP